MTEKRFTMFGDMANIKQWVLDKKDNSRMSSKWEMLDKLNELHEENEQLKKDRFICLDCEHSGYAEIGCLCEYTDNWQEYITECEDFKELQE